VVIVPVLTTGEIDSECAHEWQQRPGTIRRYRCRRCLAIGHLTRYRRQRVMVCYPCQQKGCRRLSQDENRKRGQRACFEHWKKVVERDKKRRQRGGLKRVPKAPVSRKKTIIKPKQ
jgi:hypothetical protein